MSTKHKQTQFDLKFNSFHSQVFPYNLLFKIKHVLDDLKNFFKQKKQHKLK